MCAKFDSDLILPAGYSLRNLIFDVEKLFGNVSVERLCWDIFASNLRARAALASQHFTSAIGPEGGRNAPFRREK
jgi:hypothetical protein